MLGGGIYGLEDDANHITVVSKGLAGRGASGGNLLVLLVQNQGAGGGIRLHQNYKKQRKGATAFAVTPWFCWWAM